MKPFIHIGIAKSASTFLQLEVFPDMPGFYNFGKHHVDQELKRSITSIVRNTSINWYSHIGEKSREIFAQHIQRSSDENLRPLLSEEDLSVYKFLDPEIMAQRLFSIFGPYDVMLIIRSPFTWIKSQYLFRLSTGEKRAVQGFEYWANAHFSNRAINNDINELWFCTLVDCYKKHSKGNLYIMPYEILKQDKNKFAHFMSSITSVDQSFFIEKLSVKPKKNAHKLSINDNQRRLFECLALFDNGDSSKFVLEVLKLAHREKLPIPKDFYNLLLEISNNSNFDRKSVYDCLYGISRAWEDDQLPVQIKLGNQLETRLNRISRLQLKSLAENHGFELSDFGINKSIYLEST